MFYGQTNVYVPGSTGNGIAFTPDMTSVDALRLSSSLTSGRLSGEGGLSPVLETQLTPLTPSMLAAYGLGHVLPGVTRPTPVHPGVTSPRLIGSGWPQFSWAGLQVSPRPPLAAARMFNPGLLPAPLPEMVGGDVQKEGHVMTSSEGGSPTSQSAHDIPMPPVIPTKEYPWLFHSCHPDILR